MTRAHTLLLYLYSTRHIVGSLLALLGLGAYFGGLIDQWWLPICMALYAAGALAVPSPTLIDLALYQQYDSLRLAEGVQQLIAQCQQQLPPEALSVLRAIPPVLEPLLPRLSGADGSPLLPPAQIQTVVGALTRDLPETLAGYLRLPPAFARHHRLDNGRTANELLVAQLNLLREQLERIATAAFADDAQALVSNGQYLQEKFHAPTYLS